MTLEEFFIKIGFKTDKSSEAAVEDSIKGIKDTATKLLGALSIGFSLTQLNDIAEEFGGINDQLNHATKELGEQRDIQQQVVAAANDARVAYSDMVGVVSNLVQQDKNLFGDIDEATEFAALTTKLYKTAGRSDAEISSLQTTLNKAFANGQLDLSGFNQLLENSPETVELLTSSLGVTKEALAEMAAKGKISSATLKNAFTSSADSINAEFDSLGFGISDALLNIRNRWGLWVADMDDTLNLTNTIGTTLVKAFDKVMDVLQRVQARVEWLAEKLGGADNLLRLIAITAGAIFLAFNFSKIVDGISNISKVVGKLNLKMLAIAAVIVLIALLIEDFIAFMSGEDSLIGSLFDKAGIGADNAREAILNAWNTVKDFLINAWETIRDTATAIFGKLSDWWQENGEAVKETLLGAWNAVKDFLIGIWDTLSGAAKEVFGALSDWWSENGAAVMESFSEIWEGIKSFCSEAWNFISDLAHGIFEGLQTFWDDWGETIITVFGNIWDTLVSLIQPFIDALSAIIDFLGNVFSGDWEGALQSLKDLAESIWEMITIVFTGAWDNICAVWENFSKVFPEFFEKAKKAVVDKVNEIKDGITDGFQKAMDWLGGLPGPLGTWGSTIAGVFSNIWNTLISLIEPFKKAISAIINFIKSIFKGDWEGAWESIKEYASAIWEMITTVISGAWDNICSVWSGLSDTFGEIFELAKSVIGEKITAIKETVVEGFQKAIDWIKELPSQAVEWGKDIILGIVDGITGVIGKVGEAASGIASNIKSFLGFSEPEEGPLSNFHTYMPDMIDLMTEGILGGKDKVKGALEALTGDMSVMAQANIASPSTAALAGGGAVSSRSVTQNVEIKNEFKGDVAGQEKSAAAMDKAAGDATAELARAIAFVR